MAVVLTAAARSEINWRGFQIGTAIPKGVVALSKKIVASPLLSPPIAPYPTAVKAGDLIFVSGIVGTDSAGKLVGGTRAKADMTAQTNQILNTIDMALGLVGSDASRLVQLRAFVIDWKPLERYYRAGRSFLGSRSRPTGSTVMSGLAQEGLVLEIEGVAVDGGALEIVEGPAGPASGPYARGGVRAGNLLFASGCTALTRRGRVVRRGDVREQSRIALENLGQTLASGGFSPGDVMKLFVTLADARQLAAFNRVYQTYFDEPRPAVTVTAGLLPVPGLSVGVDAIASKDSPSTIVAPKRGKWSDTLATPIGPYSQAFRAGNLAYISGLFGLSPNGRLIGAGDMKAQTVRALEQLAASLELLGLTADDVVKTTVYITDWREYVAYNEVYGDFFRPPYPARSTVQMGLPVSGALIQLDAIAVAGAAESAIVVDSDRTFWKGGKG